MTELQAFPKNLQNIVLIAQTLHRLTGVVIKDTKSGETSELNCDGAFVAIGHQPNSDLFRDQLELDNKGYVRPQAETTCTSVPGVFASGDRITLKVVQIGSSTAGRGLRFTLNGKAPS